MEKTGNGQDKTMRRLKVKFNNDDADEVVDDDHELPMLPAL